MSMKRKSRLTLEDFFHLWAFRTAFNAYPATMGNAERFARAIVASSGEPPATVIRGWRAVMRDLRELNREFATDPQRRTRAYWERAYAAIETHTGIKVTLRAGDIDRLDEIDVGDDDNDIDQATA